MRPEKKVMELGERYHFKINPDVRNSDITVEMQQISFLDSFHTKKIPLLGDIPVLGKMLFSHTNLTTFMGILILAAAAIIINKTRFGLRLRSCGKNPQAADSVGINVCKIRYAGVVISGVFGGI